MGDPGWGRGDLHTMELLPSGLPGDCDSSRSDESPAVGIVWRRGILGSRAGLWGLSSPESGLMRHLCALCLSLPRFAQTEELTGFHRLLSVLSLVLGTPQVSS